MTQAPSALPSLRARAATFGLSESEYDLLVSQLERHPNALEAAIVGAMWSEHCGYKNSRPLFKAFPTEGPQVLQGPGENAGVVDIGEGWGVAFKMESHNHPSAVEPVQGAATGVGGILRDIFAMGARPFAVLDSLRFGDPESPRTKFLVNGVVEGISHYGNAIGVPTVGGEVTFHPSYQENPLVNVMALGLLRHEDLAKGTMGEVGNQIIYVGSKTGRDGLGGAVFASADLSDASQADRPAVQVGDPFMEKLLLEATLEAIEAGVVAGVQDMGAAGLVSSTCEMAYRAGLGITMNLNDVPTRETGMVPMELCLSESQERMILVPVPGREQELYDLLAKWELDVVNIGQVEAHHNYRLIWKGEVVCDLPVALLNEAPKYTREGVESPDIIAARERDLSGIPVPDDLGGVLRRLLAHPTIASKRPIFERYDQQVMTNTVTLPGAADAAVLRVKGSAAWAWPPPRTATRASCSSIRMSARRRRWPRPPATWPAWEPRRWRSPTTSTSATRTAPRCTTRCSRPCRASATPAGRSTRRSRAATSACTTSTSRRAAPSPFTPPRPSAWWACCRTSTSGPRWASRVRGRCCTCWANSATASALRSTSKRCTAWKPGTCRRWI